MRLGSPHEAVMHFRSTYDALGYHAADYAREQGLGTTGGTADYHSRYDRETLVNLARQLDRDNWLVEGCLNRAIDYIIGASGFRLQAKTDVPGVNDQIEQELWPAFTEQPEVRHLLDWPDLQDIVLRELWCAGDTLLVKLGAAAGDDGGRLQHLESERVKARSSGTADGETIEQGVVLNGKGQVTAFNIAEVDRSGYVRGGGGTRLDARNAIYVLNRTKRSSQTRGLPVFVSAMPLCHRLDDILTSEAVAWQVLSRLVVALNRKDYAQGRPPIRASHNAEETDRSSTATEYSAKDVMSDLDYGIFIQGHPGDEVKPVIQGRPGQNFTESVRMMVRLLGVPVGIPLEMLLLDWKGVNYSNARAILLQAFINFRRWQQLLVRRMCSRVYHWQVGRWVAEGKLGWRPSVLQHTWDVPGWPWIDEDKEVSAWAKKIDRGLATQTQALASLAQDRQEFLTHRKREIIEALQAAREIEEETGGEIKAGDIWRHLSGMEEGKTAAAARVEKEGERAPDDDGAPEDQEPEPPSRQEDEEAE